MAKNKKVFSFEDLGKEMKKVNDNGDMIDDSPHARVDDWIGFGNYALNAQISGSIYKGFASGKITTLSGSEGVGKTFLALNGAREAQLKGYDVIWIDTEHALNREDVPNFGIDTSRFRYEPISTVEDVNIYMKNLVDKLETARESGAEIPKIMIVLDSLGNLSTEKEMKDTASGSEKKDMTRAAQIKKMFRVCAVSVGKLQIPMLVINHTYKTIGSFIQMDEVSGGTGVKYNSSVILILTKAQLKDGKLKTGIIITSKIYKSRFTQGGKNVKFMISYVKGMNPYAGLEDFISWDTCGIEGGKIDDNGEFIAHNKSSAPRTYAIKHLNKHIKSKDLLKDNVFTKEVLDDLAPKVASYFQFQRDDEDYDFNELDDEIEDDE